MKDNPLYFSWSINWRWVIMLSVAVMPGVLTSLITGKLMWLVASFLAVCGVIPYSASHNSRILTLFNSILICIVAYILHWLLSINWQYFLMATVCLAFATGILDNGHANFRVLSSWIIIGCVYGSIKLGEYPLSTGDFVCIIGLACIGAVMVMVLPLTHPSVDVRLTLVPLKDKQFLFNFKYIIPSLLAILAWHYFRLEEPEWIIWSALSVTYPEISDVILKFKQRAIAGSAGVACGLIAGLIIPHSLVVTYLCFIFICLSLKMFNDYFPGYLLRSFLAVLYAANHGSWQIAVSRISDVIIGGIIGVVSAYLFHFIYCKYILES